MNLKKSRLNNLKMGFQRNSVEYEAIMLDLYLVGILSKEAFESLTGRECPNYVNLPNGMNPIYCRPDEVEENNNTTDVKEENNNTTDVKEENNNTPDVKEENNSTPDVKEENNNTTDVKEENNNTTDEAEENNNTTDVKEEVNGTVDNSSDEGDSSTPDVD